jgi:hypothetical protein
MDKGWFNYEVYLSDMKSVPTRGSGWATPQFLSLRVRSSCVSLEFP